MANETDDGLYEFTPGGTLQLNKGATIAPAAIPPAATSTQTQSPPILSTSFDQIVGGVKPRLRSDLEYQADAADRVWNAAKEGYEASKPDLFPPTGPLSRPAMEEGLVGKYISVPAVEGIRQALGLLGGAGAGAMQMVKEQLATLDPLTSKVGLLDPTGTGFGRVSGAGPLSSDVSVMPTAFGGSPGDFADITAPVTRPVPGTLYDRNMAMGPDLLAAEAKRAAAAAAPNSAVSYATGKVGYKNAEQNGVTFHPDFVDDNIDSVVPASPREIARAKAQDATSPVAAQQERLQAFKGKPMTIEEYQGMMEGVKTSALDASNTGSPSAPALWDMYHKLQAGFEGAAESDLIAGDTTGIQSFRDANKATSQAHKQEAIEDMWKKANMTENPTASMKTQMKNFTTNEAKTRGWTDAEIAAAERAGERGAWGSLAYGLGSGLSRTVGAGAGTYFGAKNYGPVGAVGGGYAGNVAGNVASYPFRLLANQVAKQRIQNALGILGQSVPERPLPLPEADVGSVPPPQPQARPQPAWGAWDNG